jgi:hypothetical protein
MNIKILTITALAVILAGCGTIKNHDQLAQPIGKDLETYVGGTIFKVTRSRDLPNAFGRADLFGGKVFAGYTELRYQGLTDDGRVVLRVTEVETQSTETTMSRYGKSTGSYQGYADRRGNVSGSLTVKHPRQGSTDILPPNTTQFAFDTSKEKELVIAGVRVSFIEFTLQRLRYRLATQL